MSVAVPHIPGDGRLDTLLDNQLDSSACQLRSIALLSVNTQPNTWYKWCVLCSPNSRTIVSASLGRSLTDVLWSQCGHPPNVVACTLLSPILQDVRVCLYRGCVPSGRVSCGEEWQLTGGCGFKKHSEVYITVYNCADLIHWQLCHLENCGPLLHSASQCSWKPDPHCTHPYRHTHTHCTSFNLRVVIHLWDTVQDKWKWDVKLNDHLPGN